MEPDVRAHFERRREALREIRANATRDAKRFMLSGIFFAIALVSLVVVSVVAAEQMSPAGAFIGGLLGYSFAVHHLVTRRREESIRELADLDRLLGRGDLS